MKIYVGNLSYALTEDELRQEFAAYGAVTSASIIMDRDSGRSKGFAFVEMTTKAEGDAAIAGLNGKMMKDRTVVVNEARPRTDDRSSGSERRYGQSSDRGRGGRPGGGGGGGGRQGRY